MLIKKQVKYITDTSNNMFVLPCSLDHRVKPNSKSFD